MKLDTRVRKLNALVAALLLTGGLSGRSLEAQESGDDAADRIADLLQTQSGYTFGDSTDWQADFLEALRDVYGNRALELEGEDLIRSFLLSDATYAAKKAVWREFANLMSERSLPAILSLIDDSSTRSLALLILQISDLEDQESIGRILPSLPESEVVGLLNHLGSRQSAQAAEIAARYLQSEHPSVVQAAFTAVANTGDRNQASIMRETFSSLPRPVPTEVGEAYLRYAERLSQSGEANSSTRIYESLLQPANPDPLRAAALFGLFSQSPDSVAFIRSRLETIEPVLKPDLIRMVTELPHSFGDGISLLNAAGLSDENRAQLLLILATRKDTSIRNYAVNLLGDSQQSLRMAALKSLREVASINEVRPLFEFARNADRDEEPAAMDAIRSIPDPAVDRQLLAYLKDPRADSQLRSLQLLRERNASVESSALFQLAKAEDRKVQTEAIRTLGVVGSQVDLRQALDLLIQSESSARRSDWVNTVYRLALKNPDEAGRFDPLIEALDSREDPVAVRALLSILGEYKDPAHYPLFRAYLGSKESSIRTAALRALGNWPNSDPMPDLVELYRTIEDSSERQALSRTILGLLKSLRSLPESERLELLGALMTEARNDSEKITLLAGYSEVDTIESLQTLVALMKDETLRTNCEAAIREVARNVYRDYREPARKLLLEARRLSTDSSFHDWIDAGFRNQRFSR